MVLSYAILAQYFPRELAGRANAALNLFHIGGAFVLQYLTGAVVQLWTPIDGHYPEIAYQTAFALNVGLQIAAAIWFAFPFVQARLWRWRQFGRGLINSNQLYWDQTHPADRAMMLRMAGSRKCN